MRTAAITFVIKLSGEYSSWEPGSNEFDVRYYYQPKGTYVIHTMTGRLTIWMDSTGSMLLIITLLPNLVLTLEYYGYANDDR